MTILPEANLLASESSPYLRQHKDNPVHWRPWSRDALDEAKNLERPILLSIGYAACHWCHVMAHESFENDGVAEVMNRLFVNIKVDREERPDIDQIYMAALTGMGEQGGWPLTIFLTPDARPFWGGTYFPREARFGRPGFTQVLEAVARTWTEKRDDLGRSADALTAHVEARLSPAASKALLNGETLPAFAASIHSAIDHERGGLQGAPKFPNAPFMNVLWLNWLQNGDAGHRDAVIQSLQSMLSGGIYDHLGGGLCRYSTDGSWLVPHFEKMLYDNAQLINLAASAYAFSANELFRVRIEETVEWLSREMMDAGGGFSSSLDADSEGEEGKFYLWSEDQIRNVLGAGDATTFLSKYQLSKPDGWEGDPILNRLTDPAYGPADFAPEYQAMKQKMLAARGARVRPGRDDKVLVDWNGLAISALARAGRVFERPDWIELARKSFRFVSESQENDRLPHSILGDQRLFPGLSSDYAAMITAAVSLYEASGEHSYLEQASRWMKALDRWYGDEAATGHYLTAMDCRDVPMRVRGDTDEAIPSATSQVIEAMLRLAMATTDDELYQRAVLITEHALGRVAQQRYGQAGIVCAAEFVREPKKLIIVDTGKQDLISVANRMLDLARTDIPLRPEPGSTVSLPDGAVLDASTPGAWLCIGQRCLPPARSPEQLRELLQSPG